MLRHNKFILGILALGICTSIISYSTTTKANASSHPLQLGAYNESSDSNLPSKESVDKNGITWEYKELSDGTIYIKYAKNVQAHMEVPAQLNGKDVSVLGAIAEYKSLDHDSAPLPDTIIQSVKIPQTVKFIQAGAFHCTNLTDVQLPSNIWVDEDAFENTPWFENQRNSNRATTSTTNNTNQTPTVQQGWHKDGYYWNWLWSNGIKRTGWYNEGNNWYYFYGNGQMATEFTGLGDGAIYYLSPQSDGRAVMVTGWQKINGYWFYFNPNSDGYKGIMERGWIYDGGNWYYLYSTGEMAHNTTIDGRYVNSSGAWA